MLVLLIAVAFLICAVSPLIAYRRYKDVFHPAILIAPMCLFLYVYMPLKLINSSDLFNFVSEDQATFYELLAVLTMAGFFAGMLAGGEFKQSDVSRPRNQINQKKLHLGAYFFGGIGFAAWAYTIHNAGGFSEAFGVAYGGGWSDVGYVRDAAYLTIVALVLLLSPEGFKPKSKVWLMAVAAFSMPWVCLCLLGARRGPTFMITVCMGMSWFLARRKRPSIVSLAVGGTALGLFMLFLVTNRDHICLKCDLKLSTDVSSFTSEINESNEYIFGTGCVAASRVYGKCYWGKRYIAQVTVRPIPRQIWPTKYQDTGLEELLQNAGVAGPGLSTVMGWGEIPGAAASMVADLWVEFNWLEIPVAFLIGWSMARVWRLGITRMGFWMTQYVIICVLSVYFVTQSGEAVISRSVILSVPSILVWKFSRKPGEYVTVEEGAREIPLAGSVQHA